MSKFQKEKKEERKASSSKTTNEANTLTKNFCLGIYHYLTAGRPLTSHLQISVKLSVSNSIDEGSLSEIHFNLIETEVCIEHCCAQ